MLSSFESLRLIGTLLTVGLTTICHVISEGDPRVILTQGVLRGFNLKSRLQRDIFAFQGIPYALPPIGKLRFKPPQDEPPPHWCKERVAHKEGEKCLQKEFLFQFTIGSEDCLYLNVYTPKLQREGKGLCVMVWFHGGGFFSGSGNADIYGPELLLDHDVILVTANYRLGALGFLNLGSTEASGNYGLKDQVAVLRWVKKNIIKFGGNPECVTIFGQSAGGASVHYLMLSPLSRGLFHRAIAQSGSAHNPWALDVKASEIGIHTAVIAGCKNINITTMVTCLQKIEADKYLEIPNLMKEQHKYKRDLYFVPSIEPPATKNAFLTDLPQSMLARGEISDVPLMTGLMTHEGMLQLAMLEHKSPQQDYRENQDRFVPAELGLRRGTPDWSGAWRTVDNFYKNISKGDFIEQYVLMYSDVEGVLGVDDLVRGIATLKRSPVFYYQFSFDGSLGHYKQLTNIKRKGTMHCDEIGYMFSPSLLPIWTIASNADQMTINRVTKLWTNFACTGLPTPNAALGVQWEPVSTSEHQPNVTMTRYLDIGETLVMTEKNLNEERVTFWQQLRQYYKDLQSNKLSARRMA